MANYQTLLPNRPTIDMDKILSFSFKEHTDDNFTLFILLENNHKYMAFPNITKTLKHYFEIYMENYTKLKDQNIAFKQAVEVWEEKIKKEVSKL